MAALIAATRDENYPATISLVISNRPEAPGLERAAAEGVATAVLDHRAFADRPSFDSGLRSLIEASGAELVACAGYMRIMTPEFVDAYAGRMINIHPALLPLYRGLDTHARVAVRVGRHEAHLRARQPLRRAAELVACGGARLVLRAALPRHAREIAERRFERAIAVVVARLADGDLRDAAGRAP